MKSEPVQRQEEEELQMKPEAVQRQEKETKQGNIGVLQKKEEKTPNNTGLPDKLKSGIENLSGHSMDDVKVHFNSDKPAQLQAHAYAQGTDIHMAPGQDKHLPHEAWHVVQQKQGRVKPTMQLHGKVNVNDDAGLEKEADVMGAKALQMRRVDHATKAATLEVESSPSHVIQRVMWSVKWWWKTATGATRGPLLKKIDAALENYWLDKTNEDSLSKLRGAIYDFKKDKGEGGEWVKDSNRAKATETLSKQVTEAFKELKKAEKVEAGKLEDAIVTEEIKAMALDSQGAADALFTSFLKYGRSKGWTYQTHAVVRSILDGQKKGQCRSFAKALAEMFKKSGIDPGAEAEEIPDKNFITVKLGASFIDSSATGNLKAVGGNYGDTKKFFFYDHVITNTKFGKYDPTSGVKGDTKIWESGFIKKGDGKIGTVWKNANYQIKLVGDSKHGGGYRLSKLGG